MLLEQLRDFEWFNEPENVAFNENGMLVTAKGSTDFWQNARKNIHSDNGHFFFVRKSGNFVMELRWEFPSCSQLEQCGLMLRFDEKNWMKASLMSDNLSLLRLGSCVTNSGYTDWSAFEIPQQIQGVSLRLKRFNSEYALSYSFDEEKFSQIRLFSFVNEDVEIKAGAYICSPKTNDFTAVLKKINFE